MNLPYYVAFDPILATIPLPFTDAGIPLRWYGMGYLAAFIAFMVLGHIRAKKSWTALTPEQVGDFLFYAVIGVILGGRLGYVLFYQPGSIVEDPVSIFRIWDGGMSFHGGLIGVLLAFWYYARKIGKSWWAVAEFVAPMAALGLFFGRLGNFINGELWGRYTDAPWGMIFPNSIEYNGWASEALYQAYLTGALNDQARHPSQLYEAALEGLLMFIILWWYSSKPRPRGMITGLFLLIYGASRFFVEFFREPDDHLGFLAMDWLTMGMVLSLPMVIIGLGLIIWAQRNPVIETHDDKTSQPDTATNHA